MFFAFFDWCSDFFFAAFVRPSTPPRFHSVERQSFLGHSGGFSISGIQRWPQTSHSATRIVFHAMPDMIRPDLRSEKRG
jgi:hypothetical protein